MFVVFTNDTEASQQTARQIFDPPS